MFRHVVLLRRDPSLGLALRALLHGTGRVTELPSIQAWSALPPDDIDAVVIDLPVPRRKQAINLVRSRFNGRLVLVLEPNDDPAAVPTDHACSVVQRPFEIVELWHLVTTDPTYLASLSPGSTWTLELQGGAMSDDERASFERHPQADDAVALRRADEAAKVAGRVVDDLDRWRPVLEQVMGANAS